MCSQDDLSVKKFDVSSRDVRRVPKMSFEIPEDLLPGEFSEISGMEMDLSRPSPIDRILGILGIETTNKVREEINIQIIKEKGKYIIGVLTQKMSVKLTVIAYFATLCLKNMEIQQADVLKKEILKKRRSYFDLFIEEIAQIDELRAKIEMSEDRYKTMMENSERVLDNNLQHLEKIDEEFKVSSIVNMGIQRIQAVLRS